MQILGWQGLGTRFLLLYSLLSPSKKVSSILEPGKMLLLDLDSTDREQYTRTKSYMGQPFIFNMIHTFGGQMALFGRNHRINTRPFQARQMNNSTLVGRLTIINSRWKKIAQQLRLIIPLKTVYHKAFQPPIFYRHRICSRRNS